MENETIQTKKPSLFGMVFSPGDQFERMREKPVIWFPLILLTVLGVGLAILIAFNTDYTQVPGMEGISADEAELMSSFAVGTAVIGSLIGVPIAYLFQTAVFFLAAKIGKSEIKFKQMFSMILFTSFIPLIGSIINFAIIYAINGNPAIILTSLNSIVNANGALGAFLGLIEVFTIWNYILLGMGLLKVAKLSKRASITIVVIYFILSLLLTMGSAMLNEGLTQL